MTDVNQRLASLHEARDTFFKALKTHEHSIYKLGYEDGFQAGWEAALSQLSQLKPEVNFVSNGPTDLGHLLHREADEIPTRDTILRILSQNPGIKRQDLVELAEKQMPTLNERSVRTALQRMKNAGELKTVENKWFLAEKRVNIGKATTAAE